MRAPLITLSFHERNAAIRAYNSWARDTLARGEMIDAIIAAINEERGVPRPKVRPSTVCTVEDCGRAIKAKGLCNKHYTNRHRTGDPRGKLRAS